MLQRHAPLQQAQFTSRHRTNNTNSGHHSRAKCNALGTVVDTAIVEQAAAAAAAAHPNLQPHAAVAMAAAAALVGPMVAKAAWKELQPKRCKECLGTGYVVCSMCQGRGRQGLSLPGEPLNNTSCPQCGKRGCCKCDQCNATGLSNYWLWQPAADPGWGTRGNL